MDEIIGTLMWRINDEAEGRIVNATINVLDRVHKQYLTMCQTEVTTKNIEFSFLINRLMVECVISGQRLPTIQVFRSLRLYYYFV